MKAALPEKYKAILAQLDIPAAWIGLLCGLLALLGGQTGIGLFTLLTGLAFAGLWVAVHVLRGPSLAAELPHSRAVERSEQLAAPVLGGLCGIFGLLYIFLQVPALAVLRDLSAALGIAFALLRTEQVVAASCFALNVRLLKGDEVLEQGDDPYVLGNADVAVINPDVFSKTNLLPPKFFYCGSMCPMGAMDGAAQRYLLQAVISCAGEGADIYTCSELLVKNSENSTEFREIEQTEENGLTLSRQAYGNTQVTFIKGSCGAVAPRCTHTLYGGQIAAMTREELSAVAQARLTMKKRGCRPFAYAMYTPETRSTLFLGIVGFGMSREGDLKKTVGELREAGIDVCFAGTGAREIIFGMAESCGLSVTRFMTGRELSGRNIPPDSGEIASHRLFAEIGRDETEQILNAFREEKHRPAHIGTRSISCGGSSVKAAFSGRESCEKLMLCVKMRRNSERAAQGFAAARRCLLIAAVLWPVLSALVTGRFAAPVSPAGMLLAGMFAWVGAMCVSLMYKNSETPREMGRDRQRSLTKRVFSELCWSLGILGATIPLICVPLLKEGMEAQSLSLALSALIICVCSVCFAYGCGISIAPSGLLRRHPASYAVLAASVVLTVAFFSLPALCNSCGYAAVDISAWRMSVPFAIVPLLCLGVFLFIEWTKGQDKPRGEGRR